MRKMMPWGGDKTPPPPRVPQYNAYLLQQQLIMQQQMTQKQTDEDENTKAAIKPAVATTEAETEVKQPNVLPEDIELGRQKFVNLCASCHGTNAEGGVGPSLTSHTAEQIENIFQEYRSGKRKGTMLGIVKTFTTEDVANIAKFLEVYGKGR